MCTTWSQDRWLKETAKEGSEYKLLGVYKNEQGNQALTIAAADGDVRNVYSADGWSEEFLRYQYVPETEEWRENIPHDEQVQLAQQSMAKRGYIPTTLSQVEVQTEVPKQTTDDGAVRVEGKTLAEWDREGELNEDRGLDEHVHPARPVYTGEVTDEWKAYIGSLTLDETLVEMMTLPFLSTTESTPNDAVASA